MRIKFALVAVLGFSAATILAAGGSKQPAHAEDEQGVTRAVLNYINSYYQTRPELLEESVHPNLKKRDVRSATGGGVYLNEMTRSQLIAYAATANANGRWDESSRKDVFVYDIDGDIACAKLIADGWIDYFHLAKMDGHWIIVNVLWAGSLNRFGQGE